MYVNSTQKKYWTFADQTKVEALRTKTNDDFKKRYEPVVEDPTQSQQFLSPKEEALLCRIVTETAIRFGNDFRPALPPTVRWIAFAYFKRFYLYQSAMEFSPKNIMMVCYYLAAKTDEFNLSIDTFVSNLRNGDPESNVGTIITLEPALVSKLKYHLTVHCPFRPMEGHFISMKTRCNLNFDLEIIRPQCADFLKKALIGDVMLLHPPSQIALAALLYGFRKNAVDEEILRKYLVIIMEIDTLAPDPEKELVIEKLQLKLNDIIACVLNASETPINPNESAALQAKMRVLIELVSVWEPKLEPKTTAIEPFDSDDDF